MVHYRRIGVTVKSGLSHKDEAVERIVQILQDMGAEVFFDSERQEEVSSAQSLPIFSKESEIDLLLVIGGDGTILRAVRQLQCTSVPIMSVNRGTVGFLAETDLQEAETLLPRLIRGEGVLEQRSLLDIRATRGEEVLYQGLALNEAVISQGMIARLIDLQTHINGEPLATFHADGLIISTPSGSTAYSLAAGGPIVHPGLSATILTPINPHSFSQKPIVIRGDGVVDVEVMSKTSQYEATTVSLTIDGQTSIPLKQGDRLRAVVSRKTVKFLRREEDTFFQTLRTKLKWGERPHD